MNGGIDITTYRRILGVDVFCDSECANGKRRYYINGVRVPGFVFRLVAGLA